MRFELAVNDAIAWTVLGLFGAWLLLQVCVTVIGYRRRLRQRIEQEEVWNRRGSTKP